MSNFDISQLDWKDINWKNFEKFIYYALEREGFKNTEWFGVSGGDNGRDICATTYEELPLNLSYKRRWIFQCKKWSKLPNKALIRDEAEEAEVHNPDFWVLVIPLPIHARYYEQLAAVQSRFNFEIKVIPLHEIEKLIEKHRDLLNVLLHGTIISPEVQKEILDVIPQKNGVEEEVVEETITLKTSKLEEE
ncbi:TPA: restriction endonuclease [Bacillus cytotoxicus]|nr:restriction endonuclease [Bacillus cytotoxicus]